MQDGTVSRRQFLKVAGIAGATLATGGGLGGLISACADEDTTTSSTSGIATSAGGTSTSVEVAVEKGRPIKIGLISATTGAFSSFSMCEKWWIPHLTKAVGDGVVCADGKTHTFDILSEDSQSSSSRAAQVAGDLILNSNIDLLVSQATPVNNIPAQAQAEALGCPCLVNFTVPEVHLKAAPDGLRWTFLYANTIARSIQLLVKVCGLLPSNKQVAFMAPNGDDGIAYEANLAPILKENGYTVVSRGLYPPGAEDFATEISAFKKEGCEILLSCAGTPPDFANLWKACYQQGFQPKLAFGDTGVFFPSSLEALGDIGANLLTKGAYNPAFPFKDSLTGQTAPELVSEFEEATGRQWDITVVAYSTAEWFVDVFKRSTNVDDKTETVRAIQGTNMVTISGPLDLTTPVDPNSRHMHPNICLPPIGIAQWRKSNNQKWRFDQVLVASLDPDVLPVDERAVPMDYA